MSDVHVHLVDFRPSLFSSLENFPQLITEFKAVTQCYTGKLCRTSMISAVDYITKTLLQHHLLFRFLLAEDQPLDLTTTCLAVESPPDPRPLAEGTPLEEWEKQEQVRKIEEARAKRENELAIARDAALSEMECKLLKAYESEFSRLSDADTMSEGMICSVTDSLATVHVESLLSCITHDLQQSEEEVGFQVAKVQALSPKHTQSIPSPSKSSSKLPAGKSGKAPRTGSRKLG